MASTVETYEQAIEYLFGRINFERAQPESYSSNDFKLDRMRSLLAALDNPHEKLPAIHVAGTKGKGSTCSLLATVLNAHGCRAGLFTSPHLTRYEERMQVDGRLPAPEELVALVNRIKPAVAELDRAPARMHPTFFEITNVLGWLYFLDQKVRCAVLETGLGGRLDSTNLCQPWVTVITNVSRDHMQFLGDTVREIATEKAGIIKPGVPVISGCEHPAAIEVLERTCAEKKSELWLLQRDIRWKWRNRAERTIDVTTPKRRWENLPVVLLGDHQATNLAVTVAALDRLPAAAGIISPEIVRTALAAARWPARLELVSQAPRVILDAAHNWASARALRQTIDQDFPARRRLLVFACSRDKDYRGLIRQLSPVFDTIIFTRYVENPRATDPVQLQGFLETVLDRPSHLAADPVAAWKLARRLAYPEDLIVITGSLFLVAELRDLLLEATKPSTAISEPPHSLPVS